MRHRLHEGAPCLWVERKWEQTRPRDPGDLPTPGQFKVIEHLWHDLSEYESSAARITVRRGFYEKRLKIPSLGPQIRAQANTVIGALKKPGAARSKSACLSGLLIPQK